MLESRSNFLKISKRLNQKLKFIVPLGILKQFKWLNILQIKKNYHLCFLSNKNIKKIDTAKKLYESITKELELSNISKHNKYDIWTKFKKNIISQCLKNLSKRKKLSMMTFITQKFATIPDLLIQKRFS